MHTTEPGQLKFLDGLRAVAIASVFIFHCLVRPFGTDHLGLSDYKAHPSFLLVAPFTLGWAGVPIFFVISGFCIHLGSGKLSLMSYLTRRFFRIYPPYVLALLFFAFIFPVDPTAPKVFRHLFLLQNLGPATIFAINPALWSVAVEFQLYLIYPILFWIARHVGWSKVVVGTAVIELGLKYLDLWSNIPLYYLFTWSLGAYAADCYLRGKFPKFLTANPLLWLSLALIAPFSFSWTLFGLVTVSLISRNLAGLSTLRYPVGDHLVMVGKVSYSIYLLHHPLLLFVGTALHDRGVPPMLAFSILILMWFPILGISYWYHKLVEMPTNDIGKWLVRRGLRAVKENLLFKVNAV